MPNLLQRSATWLGEKLQTAGGRTVTYRRGVFTVALTLPPNMHDEPVINSDGLGTTVRRYGFTLVASELIINSEVVEPRAGDRIEETLNGVAIVWEVLPLDENKKCFEWMDSSGLLIKVHTKQVA